MARRAATPEADVLAQCLALLKVRGVFAWRASTHGVRRCDAAGREFWAHHGLKGCPDIVGVLAPAGRLLGVECKRPGGRLTKEQSAVLASLEAAGALCLVISDVTQLDAALRAEGVYGP
jgi:hypothetical protein